MIDDLVIDFEDFFFEVIMILNHKVLRLQNEVNRLIKGFAHGWEPIDVLELLSLLH